MSFIDNEFLRFIRKDKVFGKLCQHFCSLCAVEPSHLTDEIFDLFRDKLDFLETGITRRSTIQPDSTKPLSKNNFNKSDVMRAFVLIANPDLEKLNKILEFFLTWEERKITLLLKQLEKNQITVQEAANEYKDTDFFRQESLLKNMLAYQVHYDPMKGEKNKQRTIQLMKDRIAIDFLKKAPEKRSSVDWEKRFEYAFNILKISLNICCMHKAYYLRDLYKDVEGMLTTFAREAALNKEDTQKLVLFLEAFKEATITTLDSGLERVDSQGRLIELSYEKIKANVNKTIPMLIDVMRSAIFETKNLTFKNKIKKEINAIIGWINHALKTNFSKFDMRYEEKFFKIFEKRSKGLIPEPDSYNKPDLV